MSADFLLLMDSPASTTVEDVCVLAFEALAAFKAASFEDRLSPSTTTCLLVTTAPRCSRKAASFALVSLLLAEEAAGALAPFVCEDRSFSSLRLALSASSFSLKEPVDVT